MKRICFIDENNGVWEAGTVSRKGLNFREIKQKARAIEKAIGIKLKINMINGEQWNDITDWVLMRG